MPTGQMNWEMAIWLLGLIAAAATGAGGAVLWGVRLFAARDRAISDVREELSLKILATETQCEIADKEITDRLNAFQMHVGETFATKAGVSVAIDRMDASIGKLGEQMDQAVDRITTRLDRLIDASGKGTMK